MTAQATVGTTVPRGQLRRRAAILIQRIARGRQARARACWEPVGRADYFEQHQRDIERALSSVLLEVYQQRPSDPLSFISARLMSSVNPAARWHPTVRAACASAEAADALSNSSEEQTAVRGWTEVAWLHSLDLAAPIARRLMAPLARESPTRLQALTYLSTLGGADAAERHAAVYALLAESDVTGALSEVLSDGLVALAQEQRAAAQRHAAESRPGSDATDAAAAMGRPRSQTEELRELGDKFVLDRRAVRLAFGGVASFFGGLEGMVGPPSAAVWKGMEYEHVSAADAVTPLRTSNYDVSTTSTAEWYFVVDPSPRRLAELNLAAWPVECALEAERRRRPRT